MRATSLIVGSHFIASTGVKEVANWITVLDEFFHDVPIVQFLHHWENVVFSLTAAFFLITVSFLATRKTSLIPGPLQNAVEIAVESLDQLVAGILGPKGRAHTPFIGTLFLFIIIQHYMDIITE